MHTIENTETVAANPAIVQTPATTDSTAVAHYEPVVERISSNELKTRCVILEDGRVIDVTSTHAPIWALVKGKNPRTYFDPIEMAKLEITVAEHGVIQPIIVRVNDQGKLEIVAGERRYRAASKIFGEDYEMPITFKEYDDQEAKAVSLIENDSRDNVSLTEEAHVAAQVLADYKGNREAAAKYLGWSRKELDMRLALLVLSSSVMAALNERKITPSIAELLATLSRERQDFALKAIIENNFTTQEIKNFIAKESKKFCDAIFDKSECATCQYNSDIQSALFSENLGAGSCSNSPCYDKKTEVELQARLDLLKEEFPVVKFVSPGDNHTVIRITADGKNPVGEEQALACKSCANFGGVVSRLPNSFGKTYKGQCFDPKCNKEKVVAFAESLKPKASPATAYGGKPAAGASAAAGKTTTASAAPVKAPITSVAESPRVKEYREGIWREAVRHVLTTEREKGLSLLFALAATGNINHISSHKISDGIHQLAEKKDKGGKSISSIATMVDAFANDNRLEILNGLTRSAIPTLQVNDLVDMMKYLKIDLSQHWTFNSDFLDLLTKSEIEVVAHEIGLKKHLDKTFASLMSKKKDEFIKALMESKFNFVGVVPKIMNYTK